MLRRMLKLHLNICLQEIRRNVNFIYLIMVYLTVWIIYIAAIGKMSSE
jgi:hypothetical protein